MSSNYGNQNAWSFDYALHFQRPDPIMVPAELAISPAVRAWQYQVERYQVYWRWFNGDAFRDVNVKVKDSQGHNPPLYPLMINDIELVCLVHAAALFGRFPDKVRSLVDVDFTNEDDEEDDACKLLAKRINQIWADSHGKEIQPMGGIISQTHGGVFYKVKYDPMDPLLTHQVKFELMLPDYVLPIYDNMDFWNLLEVYVFYYIGVDEAELKYGVKLEGSSGRVLYMEHWTKTHYELKIGGIIPTIDMAGMQVVQAGDNPFGFVPFVYIPHHPRVGGFYGTSHIDRLMGLIKEKNYRLADIGSWVKLSAIVVPWLKNVIGGLKTRDLLPGLPAVDLGINNIGSKEPTLSIAQLASESGGKVYETFTKLLNDEIEKQSNMSPIVLGQRQGGSQRSGVTTATEIYPLESHINLERALWQEGLGIMHRMAATIMAVKGIGGVTKDMVNLTSSVTFYPILPVDREALVNEMSLRKPVGIVSTRNAVTQLSNGEDVESELTEIANDIDAANQQQMDMAAKQAESKAKSALAKDQ